MVLGSRFQAKKDVAEFIKEWDKDVYQHSGENILEKSSSLLTYLLYDGVHQGYIIVKFIKLIIWLILDLDALLQWEYWHSLTVG